MIVPLPSKKFGLDGGYTEHIERKDVSESLYWFYKRRLGHWITRVEDQITIGVVPSWQVEQFALAKGEPCGYIERRAWESARR